MKISKNADAFSLAIVALEIAEKDYPLDKLYIKNPTAQDLEQLETIKKLLERTTHDLQKGQLSKMFNAYKKHEKSDRNKEWIYDPFLDFISFRAIRHQYRSYRNYTKLLSAIENLDYMKPLKR